MNEERLKKFLLGLRRVLFALIGEIEIFLEIPTRTKEIKDWYEKQHK